MAAKLRTRKHKVLLDVLEETTLGISTINE